MGGEKLPVITLRSTSELTHATRNLSYTRWSIWLDSWVGLTLILAVPPSARFCFEWWEFGRSGWAAGQESGTSDPTPNPTIRPDVPPCTLAMNYFIVAKCRHTTRIHLLETNLLGSLENELVACLQSQSQSWFFKAIGHEATVSWQRRSVHEVPKGRDTFDLLCLVTLSCHCKIAIAYPNEGIVWLDDLALCITFRLRTLQLQPSNFQVPSLSRQSNAASTISLASCSEISQRELILLLLYVKFLY